MASKDEIEIAEGMLKRYSTPKISMETAHFHAMNHPEGSLLRKHWLDVRREIEQQSRGRDPRPRRRRCPARSRRDVASTVEKARAATQRIDQILAGVQQIIGAEIATPDVEAESPSLFQRATKAVGFVARARKALKGLTGK